VIQVRHHQFLEFQLMQNVGTMEAAMVLHKPVQEVKKGSLAQKQGRRVGAAVLLF
jgi:hypothetical protein